MSCIPYFNSGILTTSSRSVWDRFLTKLPDLRLDMTVQRPTMELPYKYLTHTHYCYYTCTHFTHTPHTLHTHSTHSTHTHTHTHTHTLHTHSTHPCVTTVYSHLYYSIGRTYGWSFTLKSPHHFASLATARKKPTG